MKNFYSLPLRTGDSRKVIKCQICPAAQAAFRIFAGNNLVYKGTFNIKAIKGNTLRHAESSGIQRPQSNCRPSCFANTRTVHCPGFGTLHQLYECLLTETCPHGRSVICGSRKIRLPRQTAASNLSGTLQSPRTVHGTRSRLRTGNVCSFSNPACKGPHT